MSGHCCDKIRLTPLPKTNNSAVAFRNVGFCQLIAASRLSVKIGIALYAEEQSNYLCIVVLLEWAAQAKIYYYIILSNIIFLLLVFDLKTSYVKIFEY